MDNPIPHTRGATRARIHPAPPALFSPARLSFGTVDSGDLLDLETPAIDPSMSDPSASVAGDPHTSASLGSSASASRAGDAGSKSETTTSLAASAVRNHRAPASVGPSISVVKPSAGAVHAGDVSSELATLLTDSVDWGVLGNPFALPVEKKNDSGWTPVTRRTSRSHREQLNPDQNICTLNISGSSSDNDSTVAPANGQMSAEDCEVLARRHEAYAARLRATSGRPMATKAHASDIHIKDNARNPRERSVTGQEKPAAPVVVLPSVAGPLRGKGKGADPLNWGDVRSLDGFSAAELKAQHDALQDYAETNQIIQEEGKMKPSDLSADTVQTVKTPSKGKAHRRRSKSPKSERSKGVKGGKTTFVERLLKPVEKDFPKAEPTKPEGFASVSDRDANNDRVSKSGLTVAEMFALLNKKLDELERQQRQSAKEHTNPLRASSPKKRDTPVSRGSQEDDEDFEEEYQSGEDDDDDADPPAEHEDEKPSAQRRGGRVETQQTQGQTLRVAAVDVPEHDNQSQSDYHSQGRREEYMRKGLCFNCSGRGHLARDCPSPKPARPKSEAEMDTHAVYFSGPSSRDAYVSPGVLESMHIGSVRFDIPLEVVEGGVEPLESWWEPTEIFDDFLRQV
ncbi:hypothetical protein DFH06DRAFT_1408232 [Mycena polygramma]|nr:hypothetical protein DFH06DRAFT_1408232 [Mycena polygramma]